MEVRFKQEFKKLKNRILIFGLLLFLACVGLSVIWQKSIKEELAVQATKLLGRNISAFEMREAIAALNGIQTDSFHSISYFGPNEEKIISLPPLVEETKFINQSVFYKFMYGEVVGRLYWDESKKDRMMGSISFIYPRFGLTLYAIAIWLIIALWLWNFLAKSQVKIQKNIDDEFKTQQALFLASLTKKIKHDIRSPLSVLEALIEEKPKDEKWFLEQCSLSIKRINEIISEVDQHQSGVVREKQSLKALHEINPLALQIVNEKRLVHRNQITYEFDGTMCFTDIDGGKLKATLSNLLDNAIEASHTLGAIKLKVTSDDVLTNIQVIDEGRGIPNVMIPELCSEGFTFGKAKGSGLGLFYAKKLVEEAGGNIQIDSLEGVGTTVTLFIPKKKTPIWALSKINVHDFSFIHVCDDQCYIRDLWKMRLESLGFKGEVFYFSSGEELLESASVNDNSLYLIDYHMGDNNLRGIDLIKQIERPHNSILVTGHFDDARIQYLCSEVGCKLLAKDQIANFGLQESYPSQS